MPILKTASTRRAKRRDTLARWVITLGGVTVIASVVAILALIVGVTLPLFRTPRASVVCACSLPKTLPKDKVLRLGIDMDMDGTNVTAFVWSEDGSVAWVDPRSGRLAGQERLHPPGGDAKGTLRQVEPLGVGKYALSWSNGAASLVEIARLAAAGTAARGSRYAIRSLANIPATPSDTKPRPVAAPSVTVDDATISRGLVRRL